MAAKIGNSGSNKFDLGQNADMNVTPFVDVMLVLLIIFMVVAPIATTSIKLDIPPATPPKDDKSKPPTFISINDQGAIYVSYGKNDIRPSSLEQLPYDLSKALAVSVPTEERVFIRADRHVPYGRFMQVVNQLQLDGYYKVGLIAENLGTS
jgi:biopolymer transport protein ExbD